MRCSPAADRELEASSAAPVPASEVDPLDRRHKWVCPCGRTNSEEKTRCSACQKWKGGKRGSLPRRPKGEGAADAAVLFATSAAPPYGDAEPAEHALGVRGVRELQWLSEAPMWYVFLLEEWQKAAEPAHEGRGRGSIRPSVAS
mmetsp:Transcript_1162/g.2851  ORF Transcript_1162/g.2851 Transcript_1162/m.2851 type:complete len:144 (+) Transcript_1162:380-811(+)